MQPGAFAQGQNYRGGQRIGGGYYQRTHMGGYSRSPRGGTIGKAQSPKERFRYETDYDFEKANEQFQETLNHLAKDLKKTKLEGIGCFYFVFKRTLLKLYCWIVAMLKLDVTTLRLGVIFLYGIGKVAVLCEFQRCFASSAWDSFPELSDDWS